MCGRRGEGRTSDMANEVCMACVKVKRRMANYGNCVLNALPVIDNSVSM